MIKIAIKIVMSSRKHQLFSILILTASLILILESLRGLLQSKSVSNHWMKEIEKVDLWVYPKRSFNQDDLVKIRSLEEVEVASYFCKKSVIATLPSGVKEECLLLGVDELIAPRILTQGKLSHLQLDNTIIGDEKGIEKHLSYRYRGAKRVFKMGQYIMIEKHKMLLGGLCRLKSSNPKIPIIYTSYNNAIRLFEAKNNDLIAYVVKAKSGVSLPKLSEKIERMLGLNTKLHSIALADSIHLANTPSSNNLCNLSVSLIVGCLFYIATIAMIFFDLDKKIFAIRLLGAPFIILITIFSLQGVVSFTSSWLLAFFTILSSQFICQTMVPYFSINVIHYLTIFLSTFLVVIGLIIYRLFKMAGRRYVSYRM